MNSESFFSIIIPTKSRPKLVEICLQSIKCQDFEDYEVIISDDYDKESCEPTVKKMEDSRFRYYHPSADLKLGMSGNWEYGLEKARGKYVVFIQDKMFFYPKALSELYNLIIEKGCPDSVSWNWDFYVIQDENKSLKGMLYKYSNRGDSDFDFVEVNKEISNTVSFFKLNYQNEEGAPGPGTPLCAAIKKEIFDRLRTEKGVFFDFITPDYGPKLLLLSAFARAYKLNHRLTAIVSQNDSEGKKHMNYDDTLKYVSKSVAGIERMKYATVPDMILTNTNIVVADYNYTLQTRLKSEIKECDKVNVLNAIEREMECSGGSFGDMENVELGKYYERRSEILNCYSDRKKVEHIETSFFRRFATRFLQICPPQIRSILYNLRPMGSVKLYWLRSPADVIRIERKKWKNNL